MPLDLARISARAFAVQTLDGALHQRSEVLAASGQGQGFGEEGHRIRRCHRLRQRVRVFSRRVRLKRSLLGRARQIEHLAAGGFDEQGFLGAEVIGDLARKRVRGRRNVRDRGSGKAPLLEQPAGAVEQSRAHLAPGRTRGTSGVLGIAGGHFGSGLDGFGSHFCPLVQCLYDYTNKYVNRSTPARPPRGGRPGPLSVLRKKPCQRAENPYKPRHPWIPAGS